MLFPTVAFKDSSQRVQKHSGLQEKYEIPPLTFAQWNDNNFSNFSHRGLPCVVLPPVVTRYTATILMHLTAIVPVPASGADPWVGTCLLKNMELEVGKKILLDELYHVKYDANRNKLDSLMFEGFAYAPLLSGLNGCAY